MTAKMFQNQRNLGYFFWQKKIHLRKAAGADGTEAESVLLNKAAGSILKPAAIWKLMVTMICFRKSFRRFMATCFWFRSLQKIHCLIKIEKNLKISILKNAGQP